MARPQNVISTKLPPELLERLRDLADTLTERAVGATVTRSAVARLAIERGLPELEAEAGITKRKRKRKK